MTVRRQPFIGVTAGAAAVAPAWFRQAVPGSRLRPLQHDPEVVRRMARQILARPEFKPETRPLLLRILDGVNRLINDALNRLARGPGSLIGLLLIGAGLVGLALLAFRVVRRLPPDASRSVAVDDAVGRSAVDWRAEAARHEAEGRWREALRCRYRSLIAELAERDLVTEIPGRTSGEYRSEVATALPAAAADFGAATDLFEQAWYGHAATGARDSGRLDELSGRVVARVS